ncbi:MAG TPA: sensor histidine kinase, partial [Saprospiraceae bacterium]|nr:sensor histidine kinase [Saprospiraceae bacterium]
MRNTNVRWVIILGAMAILSIIAMQSYWLIQRQTHESQSFHQSTTIALRKVAEKMAVLKKHTLPSGDFIKRITSNYYIVNYNNEIDAGILEHYLLEEFGSNVNYTDFEYGIYDCTNNTMVYGNHCNLIDAEKSVKSP